MDTEAILEILSKHKENVTKDRLLTDAFSGGMIAIISQMEKLPTIKSGMNKLGMTSLYEWFIPDTKKIIKQKAIQAGYLSLKQDPVLFFIPGLQSSQFYNNHIFDWASKLQKSWQLIRDELFCLLNQRTNQLLFQLSDYKTTATFKSGNWTSFYFYQSGEKIEENHRSCPITSALLESIPNLNRLGTVSFSALAPGTFITPHYGEVNWEVRCHLPLVCTRGSFLRVGSEQREYREGEMLIFDDTFEHHSWNDSDQTRIVLLFDVLNPTFTTEECNTIISLLAQFKSIGQEERKNQPFVPHESWLSICNKSS